MRFRLPCIAVALAASLIFAPACAVKMVYGAAQSPVEEVSVFRTGTWGLFWGILPITEVNLGTACGQRGVQRVNTHWSWWSLILVGGFVTHMDVQIECA